MSPGPDSAAREGAPWLPPGALRAVGVAVGVALAGVGALSGPGPAPLDRALYDVAVARLLPPVPPSSECVLVEVDDRTLAELGEPWPLERTTWARLFHRLAAQAPRAVAVDVVFDRPAAREALELGAEVLERLRSSGLTAQPAGARLAEELQARLREEDGDARLAGALAEAGPVLLGSVALTEEPLHLSPLGGHSRPEPLAPEGGARLRLQARDVVGSMAPLQVAAHGSGTLNMLVEPDGVIRRYPYAVGVAGRVYPSLALAVAQALEPQRAELLRHQALAADHGAPLLRLPRPGWLPRLSLVDVLTAEPDSPGLAQALRGKVVFIGVTAAGLHGQINLPAQVAVPGVEVHAVALESLREGRLLRAGGWVGLAGLVETGLLLAALAWLGARVRRMSQVLLGGAGLLALHGGLAWALAAGPGWVLPLVPTAAGLALLLAGEVAVRLAELQRQRGALRRLFARYPQPSAPEPPPGARSE